ncbi:YqcC family protein [Saccharospirillum mangrovi]|uniref:YqcC family protein n=1 Tax=Saccharospirillum mangrovi TaxID=2161747 RepID=UPI000D3BC452|nr:YqcC family protein [Saccharospirillum mangrovi]
MANLASLLDTLETELRRLSLWSDVPPSPEALASTAPFAVDQLTLPQWLQWIYIQRLRALLDADRPLPHGALVKPYADQYFDQQPQLAAQKLLEVIDRIDAFLGRPAQYAQGA